jgi:hypothetical protein
LINTHLRVIRSSSGPGSGSASSSRMAGQSSGRRLTLASKQDRQLLFSIPLFSISIRRYLSYLQMELSPYGLIVNTSSTYWKGRRGQARPNPERYPKVGCSSRNFCILQDKLRYLGIHPVFKYLYVGPKPLGGDGLRSRPPVLNTPILNCKIPR